MRAKKYIQGLNVGTVNIWEVPGYRIEMSPFGGIKDSGLGYKEGVIEAMKSFTNVKTFSLPWQITKIYNNIFILNEIKVSVQDWNNIVNDAFLEERGKNFIGN